jgi:hypothetical protein
VSPRYVGMLFDIGGGPGSVVAIYHALGAPPVRTAATFLPGDDQGAVERGCFALLRG